MRGLLAFFACLSCLQLARGSLAADETRTIAGELLVARRKWRAPPLQTGGRVRRPAAACTARFAAAHTQRNCRPGLPESLSGQEDAYRKHMCSAAIAIRARQPCCRTVRRAGGVPLPRPAAYRRLMHEEGVPAEDAAEVHQSFKEGDYEQESFSDYVVSSQAGCWWLVTACWWPGARRRLGGGWRLAAGRSMGPQQAAADRHLPALRQVECPKGQCPNPFLASRGYQVRAQHAASASARIPGLTRRRPRCVPHTPAADASATHARRSAPMRTAPPAACFPLPSSARR